MNDSYRYFIAVDTGGTFTDCIGVGPSGRRLRQKVLSKGVLVGEILSAVSPRVYRTAQKWGLSKDILSGYRFMTTAPREFSAVVEAFDPETGRLTLSREPEEDIHGRFELSAGEEAALLGVRLMTETPLGDTLPDVDLRLGTTRGTNALLERKGAPTLFIATKGFGDVLEIGTQAREDIFARHVGKKRLLATTVVEAEERVSADGDILVPLDAILGHLPGILVVYQPSSSCDD